MTKVNAEFRIDPRYEVELDEQSQAAYDRWLEASEGGDVVADTEWDAFIDEFHRQMAPYLGNGGWIHEVWSNDYP
jgi:hypothetical protein